MSEPEDIPADPATLIRVGSIVEVDLASGKCRVRYGDPDSDDEAETPAVRWLHGRSGDTRAWSPPTVGEQVVLLCPDGQLGSGVALLGLHQDEHPPAGDSLTELIQFKDGAQISYDPEGHALVAELPEGATVTINASGGVTINAEDGATINAAQGVTIDASDGGVSITGDVSIDGDLTLTGKIDADGDVTGQNVSLATHTHSGVAAGGADTGPPN